MRVRQMTKSEMLQRIVNEYIKSGEPWPADRKTIARWAVKKKKWSVPQKSEIDMCAKDLAEAMRVEMTTDPQGRTVRAKHCAKIREQDELGEYVQKTLWFDSETATPELMHLSLQQRRVGILGDCKQLKTDTDSWNENNAFGDYIQMSLDFEPDLEELSQDTEYNPPLVEDEDEDD